MNILLAAWKCDQSRGSEYLGGWGWATAYAAAGDQVWVLCGPDGLPGNDSVLTQGAGRCHFIRIAYPRWCAKRGVAIRYAYWQQECYARALSLMRTIAFDLVHHVSMASLQAGSALSALKLPLLFGPVGGGQEASPAFAGFFADHWHRERLRSFLLCRMIRFSPRARHTVRQARLVLAANPDTERLARRLGARAVVLEPDAVIPTAFFPTIPPEPKGMLRTLRLLWVGRVFPRKGLRLTLEGLARVASEVPWHVTIIGGGPWIDQVSAWVQELRLSARVTLRGQRPFDEVRQAYAQADCFIFTSLRDSGPSQLLEAMAFALPVVTLRWQGQAYLVGPDRGIRVDARTPEAAILGLAKAVTMLHHNRELLRRLSQGAYAYAQREALPQKFERVRALVMQTLGSRARGPTTVNSSLRTATDPGPSDSSLVGAVTS